MKADHLTKASLLGCVVIVAALLPRCTVEECADEICTTCESLARDRADPDFPTPDNIAWWDENNSALGCGLEGFGGQGGSGADGGGGLGGGGAGMGGSLGGGGAGGAPECMTDVDCTGADNAQCDGGTCVPCVTSPHCEGVAGLPVCDGGTCIECKLGDEDACTGGETCDLLAKECVAVAPMTVGNCSACTNDNQCVSGHRCIPMDFEMAPHGHYCLEEDTGANCMRPFSVGINSDSISEAGPGTYCGIEEDIATCEAVNALLDGWVCSGADGMCGPEGMGEQAVPGALCRQVDVLANQCTYACSLSTRCPSSISCGGAAAPQWCGG